MNPGSDPITSPFAASSVRAPTSRASPVPAKLICQVSRKSFSVGPPGFNVRPRYVSGDSGRDTHPRPPSWA